MVLVPDVAPEIVYLRGIEAPAQTLEARGDHVYLRTLGCINGCLVTLDLAVVDVNVGSTGGDADAARTDVGVGDVNLASVQGTHRIAIEHQVAVVDVQHPRSLTHDRLVPALERCTGGGFTPAGRDRSRCLRGGDAVTGPRFEHAPAARGTGGSGGLRHERYRPGLRL